MNGPAQKNTSDTVLPADSFRVSFVIPTFNSGRTLRVCLQSIRDQSYPSGLVEIIIADGGSADNTLEIARGFKVDKIVPNPLKTGEAGKSAGIKAATGDIIALVDSDNILDSPDWLLNMLAPFKDRDITATEPLWYTRRDEDPALTRYFAMLGMNDPLCLFLGNYDRYCMVTGRWTGLAVATEDHGTYLKLALDERHLPTIGANGFVFRRSLLDHVSWDPYFFDIDIMHQAILAGRNRMAKVHCGIVHLYCLTLADFARKQDRRIRDFLFFSTNRGRTYPWARQRKSGIFWFALCSVLILPLSVQCAIGCFRKRDPAWLFHFPVCWLTLWIYGKAVLGKILGVKPQARSREKWHQ